MPNISFDSAEVLGKILAHTHRDNDPRTGQISDIEDLHAIIGSKQKMERLQRSMPQTMRSVKRLLSISGDESPLVEAARTRSIQVNKPTLGSHVSQLNIPGNQTVEHVLS
jgi:hypothetical protein